MGKCILSISDPKTTFNINIEGRDPSIDIRRLVERVKSGSDETFGPLSFLPVGDYIVITISHVGIQCRLICRRNELKFM